METSPPYDKIIQQPLARLRRSVAASFSRKRLDKDFKKIADEIGKHVLKTVPAAYGLFLEEKAKAVAATQGFGAPEDINLDTPELQLLWGAALGERAILWQDTRNPFTAHPLWQALAGHEALDEERRFCAHIAAAVPGLRERQGTLKVDWGMPLRAYPDIGFYCDPQTNTVNLDMVWTLIMGIEPARSLMLRETANGLGTIFFTDAMQAIRSEMMAIKTLPERTEEQHTRMIHLAAQWLARFDVSVQAEGNFANRFAADRTAVSAQHYAASLNYAETIAGGFEEAALRTAWPVKPPVPARLKMDNLLRALHYSFFKNNNLFPDSAEGWRSVGIRPEWIETSDGSKKGMEALNELATMCKKMENLQPGATDRSSGDSRYARQMAEYSVARCKLADMIFERFAAHMVPELEQDAENNPQETMDRMEQMTGDGEGEGQEADGQDKDSAEVKDKGKLRDARVPPENPREAKGLKDKAEPGAGEGEPDEGEGEPGEGEGEPGEGEGEPGDGEGAPGEGEGEPGDGDSDSDEDGKLEDDDALSEEELKKLKELLEAGGGNSPGSTQSDAKPKLEDDGSYNEYLRIIAPHRDLIRQATALMKKIQEKLTIDIQDPSTRNSLVPEDGDVSRFQPQALQDRLVKQFSGQAIGETDFETFRLDSPLRTISPPTEIHIWIDGSGSMRGPPVEMAITTGCILYEAAREAGMDVYISMMGEPEPLPIAKPGQSDKEIGKNIASVREGQGGNKDMLSPVIGDMVQTTLAKKRGLYEPVGNTHAFAITDGGFTDGQRALDYVTAIHKASPHTTIDFVMIGGDGFTDIERLVDTTNKKDKKETLGHKSVAGARDIHDGVMELLNKRLRNVRKEDAIPLAQKQKEFRDAKLKGKKLNSSGM